MRLDRYLTMCTEASRSQVKEMLKKGRVSVNGQICRKADLKICEETDCIQMDGRPLVYEPLVYYMLNKPAGVVSATRDKLDKTVVNLLEKEGRHDLFPVGRLDKDTEGLLLLTNDGDLAHQLLSPRHDVPKTYYLTTAHAITGQMKEQLEYGVDIGEKAKTRPARCIIQDSHSMLLTITEGKFHQVKRMLKSVGNEVTYLKRISMGPLRLDPLLAEGEYRKLTDQEILGLKTKNTEKESLC